MKNKNNITPILIGILVLGVLSGCNTNAEENGGEIQENGKTAVIKASSVSEWEEMLRNETGWIGADGIYSVALNGIEKPGKADETETFFWFSDTIIGEIKNDSLKSDWEMVHNSVGYMKGAVPDPSNIKFHWKNGENGEAISMFEPKTKTEKGEYFWLGDGFFNHAADSTIYIFAYEIINVPGGVYPFDDVGVSLIALPKGSRPPFEGQRQLETPLFHKDSEGKGKVVFGISVLANTEGAGAPNPDGYIYVYGVRGPSKELVVARVKDLAFEDFSAWKYWNGSDWDSNIHKAAALTKRVSNEMSVSFMEDGRVISIYQLDTNSPTVAMQVGQSPTGPFQPYKAIYETPEIYEDIDFYTYNAKAHPHLSKPGELLISYNVNSFDFIADIHAHPFHLRPRFINLKY